MEGRPKHVADEAHRKSSWLIWVVIIVIIVVAIAIALYVLGLFPSSMYPTR